MLNLIPFITDSLENSKSVYFLMLIYVEHMGPHFKVFNILVALCINYFVFYPFFPPSSKVIHFGVMLKPIPFRVLDSLMILTGSMWL